MYVCMYVCMYVWVSECRFFYWPCDLLISDERWYSSHVDVDHLNPITGGGGGESAPTWLVFLLSTENGLRWGLEISWLFLYIHWECCIKYLNFYFAQRHLQDHFLGGMFAKFRPFFSNFRKLQKKRIMFNGLVSWETCPRICPKSFKKQRSYNISKHLVKKRRLIFFAPWTPNLRIFGIFENGSCSSRWEK